MISNVEVVHQAGTAITFLSALEGVELAILVDALQAPGDTPRLLDLDTLLAEAAPLSGHSLGLAETLLLGRQLAMLPTQLLIIGLPSGMLAQGRPLLSPLIELLDKALADLIAQGKR